MKAFERSPVVGVLVCISVIPAFLFRAYVLATLWGWFLIDAIRAEPINTFQAAGILIAWGILTFSTKESGKEEEESSWFKVLVALWMVPVFALVFGWVIKNLI